MTPNGSTKSTSEQYPYHYANDILAFLIITPFVAFVTTAASVNVARSTGTLATNVLVNGITLMVLVVVAWIYGPQTLSAVANLAQAAFAPERLIPESYPPERGRASPDVEPSPTPDGGQPAASDSEDSNEQSAAEEGQYRFDPVASHPEHSVEAERRKRMIQSQWPPLDVFLAFIILAPVIFYLLSPLATIIPLELWIIVLGLVVSLALIVIPVRRAEPGGKSLGPILIGIGTISIALIGARLASTVGMDLGNGLGQLPNQIVITYFGMVLVTVVWAFGERAALGVAMVRRRRFQDEQ